MRQVQEKTVPKSASALEREADLNERFYRSLYRIRRVEEQIAEIYPTDKIKSPVHLSIGQETASVGVCEALRPGDIAFGSYRCHALYLAKGGDLKQMIAELYGKTLRQRAQALIAIAHPQFRQVLEQAAMERKLL